MAPDEEGQEDNDSGVYGHDAREDLAENDEISPEEGAFMEGYDQTPEDEEETENEAYDAAFGAEEKEETKFEEDEEHPADDGDAGDEF